ncbi:XdhC family protein [Nocardia stercoris]|uniref:XdhC/CoxI family protein n=1 Tax=Nocardia stercoris TaxID=2483361 RepID=A0A3M2L8C6_9NOCA|nr:XdhC/CoxI family protein [Nocardia stercoris]RMI30818.1 XdhC/CoxI family protein [Nocardia stercoris]
MRDILEPLLHVWESGQIGGLATLVRTHGTSSVPIGSAMLVDPQGLAHGVVCDSAYEHAVYEATLQAARTGRRELLRFDPAPDMPAEPGAGTIDVFVEPFSRTDFAAFREVAEEVAANRRVTVFTVVWHNDPEVIGQHVVTDRKHNTELVTLPESDIFVASYAAAPRLIIFGANTVSAALAVQGRLLGYRVTVCDAHEVGQAAFPGVEVVTDWPHRYLNALSAADEIDSNTAIITIGLDPSFEIPLLTVALGLPELGYLAALSSTTARRQRDDALEAGGFDARTLARLNAPDPRALGAATAPEIAIVVAADLLASRTRQAVYPRAAVA